MQYTISQVFNHSVKGMSGDGVGERHASVKILPHTVEPQYYDSASAQPRQQGYHQDTVKDTAQ